MYKRILLAYDGSTEGAIALREGALLAKRCCAEVFLLSVVSESAGVQMAEAAYGGVVAQQIETYKAILQRGCSRLQALGFQPVAKLVTGEPAAAIGAVAAQIKADLIVVGHQRKSPFARWWSGSTGAYLSDHIRCSLLIACNPISDEAFEAELKAAESSRAATSVS
jgi:nucleotide-binding universal stress UspA family protein